MSTSELPVTHRLATAADAARLAVLAGQLGYRVTPGEARARAAEADSTLCVAVIPPGVVVGFIEYCVVRGLLSPPHVLVRALVVDEAQRNRRIGEGLMTLADEAARAAGCLRILVRTSVVRQDAHRFYERLGFAAVKTQHVLSRLLDQT